MPKVYTERSRSEIAKTESHIAKILEEIKKEI